MEPTIEQKVKGLLNSLRCKLQDIRHTSVFVECSLGKDLCFIRNEPDMAIWQKRANVDEIKRVLKTDFGKDYEIEKCVEEIFQTLFEFIESKIEKSFEGFNVRLDYAPNPSLDYPDQKISARYSTQKAVQVYLTKAEFHIDCATDLVKWLDETLKKVWTKTYLQKGSLKELLEVLKDLKPRLTSKIDTGIHHYKIAQVALKKFLEVLELEYQYDPD